MTTPVEDPEDKPNTEPPVAGKFTDSENYLPNYESSDVE